MCQLGYAQKYEILQNTFLKSTKLKPAFPLREKNVEQFVP